MIDYHSISWRVDYNRARLMRGPQNLCFLCFIDLNFLRFPVKMMIMPIKMCKFVM